MPLWSKDGSRIAFQRHVDAERALGELIVVDENGHQIDDVLVRPAEKAPPEGLRYIESMEWLSNDRIAVSGTQNISLIETLIVDLKSGNEHHNIVGNAGEEAVFSPNGSHFAYKDGTPHFSPEKSKRPTLNVDDKPVFPNLGDRVTFLSKPQWSNASDQLAIVAEDYQNKKASLVIWHSSGVVSKIPLDFALDEPLDLFWNGTALYVKSTGRAWRVQDGAVSEISRESAVDPLDQARSEAKRWETMVQEAGGDIGSDAWCRSCPLTALPRRQSVNK
jgi:hypothetical protein